MRPAAAPFENPGRILPGADFSDAYALEINGQALDAVTAAQRAIGNAPLWTKQLLALRNLLVRPLGLKSSPKAGAAGRIGFFPMISQASNELVLGLDDRHLDFRLLVDVRELGGGRQRVTVSTAVKTHNALGRAYLWLIKPFHRIIVPAMLARAAQ